MSTISVPISGKQEAFIESYIKNGGAENKAQVVRKALDRLSEEEAIREVLEAEREPVLRGDLREIMKKFK